MSDTERCYRVTYTGTISVLVRAEDADLAEQYARADVIDELTRSDLARREVYISTSETESVRVTIDNQAPSIEEHTNTYGFTWCSGPLGCGSVGELPSPSSEPVKHRDDCLAAAVPQIVAAREAAKR